MTTSKTTASVYHTLPRDLSSQLKGKIIFTNGCFDVLHAGHLKCLQEAKELGDILIIGLNSDDSVSRLKGDLRPINSWDDRAYLLSGLSCTDIIIGFEEDTPLNLIQQLRPDIICKGGDYSASQMIGKSFVESYGGEVVILPFHKGYSTTETIKLVNRSS